MLWCLSDFFVLPDFFVPFLLFRLGVSSVGALLVSLRRKLKVSIYFGLFVFVLGISIQNAYMWSVMDLEHFRKHAFAYMALFICAGMLLQWELIYSIIILLVTIVSNIIFYQYNCQLSLDEFIIGGGLITLTVAVASVFMIRQRYKLSLNEIKSRMELELSKKVIEEERNIVVFQKKQIEEKNEEITSSIRYAKRIQDALLTSETVFDSLFSSNYFIYLAPRDIVSGDFYWARKIRTTPVSGESKTFFLVAVADCTGHGVPGAFMSLIGSNFLAQSSFEKDINTPAEALDFLNRKIISTLNHGGDDTIRDGMDIGLVAIDLDSNSIAFAGANNPLYVIKNNTLEIIKADKQAIGNINDSVQPFTNNSLQLSKGDVLYLFSDGYADQFGGPNGKKLTRKRFKEVLLNVSSLPMNEQRKNIEAEFLKWRGNQMQTDDVCVVGIKLN